MEYLNELISSCCVSNPLLGLLTIKIMMNIIILFHEIFEEKISFVKLAIQTKKKKNEHTYTDIYVMDKNTRDSFNTIASVHFSNQT